MIIQIILTRSNKILVLPIFRFAKRFYFLLSYKLIHSILRRFDNAKTTEIPDDGIGTRNLYIEELSHIDGMKRIFVSVSFEKPQSFLFCSASKASLIQLNFEIGYLAVHILFSEVATFLGKLPLLGSRFPLFLAGLPLLGSRLPLFWRSRYFCRLSLHTFHTDLCRSRYTSIRQCDDKEIRIRVECRLLSHFHMKL